MELGQFCATLGRMNLLAHAQELARRFNEDEAVWQDFEQRRTVRRISDSAPPWPEDVSDDLDWMKALAACRQTRAIARVIP